MILPCRIHRAGNRNRVNSLPLALLFASFFLVVQPGRTWSQTAAGSTFEQAGVGWLPGIPIQITAGGATDYGSLSNVHLTRIIDGEQRTETINLRPTVHGKPTKPQYVQDGDVIYISRNWF